MRRSDNRHIKYNFMLLVLVFLLSFFIVRDSFLSDNNGLPSGIDTPAHLHKIEILYKSIRSGNLPKWDDSWYCGYPVFSIYSPLSYYFGSLLRFLFQQTASFNVLRFLFFFLTALMVFKISETLYSNRLFGVFSTIAFITSYVIFNNNYVVGRMPTTVAMLYFTILTYYVIKFWKKKTGFIKHVMTVSSISSVFLFTHVMIGFLWAIFILPIILYIFYISDRKEDFIKRYFCSFVVVIIILLTYIFPLIKSIKYLHPFWITVSLKPKDIELFYSGVFGDTYPVYIGSFHLVMFLISVVLSFIKKDIFTPIAVSSIFLFLLSLGNLFPIYRILPFSSQFDVPRFEFIFSLSISFLIPLSLYIVRKNMLRIVFVLLVSIFMLGEMNSISYEASNWKIDPNILKMSLNDTGYHRALLIGTRHWESYLLPDVYKIPTVFGWFPQADPHKNFTILLSRSAGTWYPYQNYEKIYNLNITKNLLELSNTKYVMFFLDGWYNGPRDSILGSYNPNDPSNTKLLYMILNDSEFKLLYNYKNRVYVFKLDRNMSFCDPVKPVYLKSTSDVLDIFSNQSRLLVVPVSVDIENGKEYSVDSHVKCLKQPGKIFINVSKPSWVLVKESYYPLWHSTNGEKIYNSFGFMLVYVENTTLLEYGDYK